jgi:hypothetical protein
MARPIKYTDAQIKSALLKCKGLVYLAAKMIGCDQDTVHRRAKKNPKLRKIIEQERGEFIDTAELALLSAVTRGESWAVCFTLKTQGRIRGYVERSEIIQKTNEEIPLEEMSDVELARVIKDATARLEKI